MKLNLLKFKTGDSCSKFLSRSSYSKFKKRIPGLPLLMAFMLLGISSFGFASNGLVNEPTETEFQSSVNPPTPFIHSLTDVKCISIVRGEQIKGTEENEIPQECIQVCAGTSTQFETDFVTGHNFDWDVVGAASFSESLNLLTVTWPSTPGSATIKVKEYDVATGLFGEHEICVLILEKPIANFTPNPGSTVCLNQTVYFDDLSSGAIKWHWDFGNGDELVYDINNPFPLPEVTYTTAGTYTVTLTVENECHCTDVYKMDITVDPTPAPVIECIGVECSNSIATYQAMTSCATYNWNVTNGTIVSQSGDIVTVEWGTGSGYGILELITTGCGNGCPNSLIYVPLITPTNQIEGASTVCAGTQERYWVSNMPGSSYTWTVSGGSIVTGQNTNEIVVNWSSSGGSISVVYHNSVLNCGGNSSKTITVASPFEVIGDEDLCQTTDLGTWTTTAGTLFSWEVIDNSGMVVASSASNSNMFTYTGTTPGNYLVVATDQNTTAFCNSTFEFEFEVNATPSPITAITGELSVCPNSAYEYSAMATSTEYFVDWNVPNGAPSQMQGEEVSIQWGLPIDLPADITVRQVDKFNGCESTPFTVTVTNKALELAVFTQTGGQNSNDCEATFSSTSTADDYIWYILPETAGSVVSGQGTNDITVQWNYNGGAVTPATVYLKIKNCGVESAAQALPVTLQPTPVPAISATYDVCEGENVTYTVTNSGLFTGGTFNWSFGTGGSIGTPTGASVTIQINDVGSHPIEVYYDFGVGGACVSPVANAIVNVKPSPTATVTSSNGNCINTTSPINLFCSAQGGPLSGTYSYQWYNGATAITGAVNPNYNATGVGNYYCIVTSSNLCSTQSNIFQIKNCTPPLPCPFSTGPNDFNWSNNCGVVTLTGSGSGTNHYFEVEDPVAGLSTYTGMSATHTFTTSGYFVVRFYAKYTSGSDVCWEVITKTVYVPLIADFVIEYTCPSNSLTSTLINNSDWTNLTGTPTLDWFHGVTPIPNVYALPSGNQDVTLTITLGGYTCSITKTINIPDQASASFTSTTPLCEGVPATFTNTSLGDVSNFHWNFGDGSNSTLESPDRTYDYSLPSGSGIQPFSVTLDVTDEYGCTNSITQNIGVYENNISTTYNPDPLKGCKGTPINLSVINANAPALTTYSWSTTETTPSIFVNQSGDYLVTVTNGNGCISILDPINANFIPIPEPTILGNVDMCHGDQLELTGYEGDDFLYQWTSTPSLTFDPSSTDPSVTVDNMVAGTYNVQLEISETASGLACSRSNSVTVTVNSNPNITGINVSGGAPFCMDSPRTLTATSTSGGSFNWSTGDYSPSSPASIDVIHAGEYGVTVTDANGCESFRRVDLLPLPEFSEFMSGCYDFCIGDVISWPGIPGSFASWRWYKDGSLVASGTGSVTPLSITTTGEYQLEVTTANGCTEISDIADISFIPCKDPCRFELNYVDAVCVGENQYGQTLYYIEFAVNGFPFPGNFTISSMGSGIVSNITPLAINAANQTIGFTYADISGNTSPCFSIMFTDPAGTWRCRKRFCVPKLPKCELNDCDFKDPKAVHISCVSYSDATNYGTYSSIVHVGVPGANDWEIIAINTIAGTATGISFSPSVLTPGTNYFNLSFGSHTPAGDKDCFLVVARDMVTGKLCYFKLCIEIPKCKLEPCDVVKLSIKNIDCIGEDGNGNPIYQIAYYADNYSGNDLTILGISSSQGTVYNVTPSVLVSGVTYVTANFIAYPPYSSPICFNFIVKDIKGIVYGSCEVCTQKLPQCGNYGKKGDGSEGETTDSGSLLKVGLRLAPNPTQDVCNISYTFVEGKPATIYIRDIQGRLIKQVSQLGAEGSIQINTEDWAAGMYFIHAVQDNVSMDKQILIKQ